MPDANKLRFEVVTPDRQVLSADVEEVILPSVDGYMGVQPGHAPLLAMLDIGEISYKVGGQQKFMTVTGGFAEVQRNSVIILAKASELAEEIDIQRALAAKEAAEREMVDPYEDQQFKIAEYKMRRAMNRIQVHERRLG